MPGVAVLAFDRIYGLIVPVRPATLSNPGCGAHVEWLWANPKSDLKPHERAPDRETDADDKGCPSRSRWLSLLKELHSAGLRAVFSGFLDESDAGADFQPLEIVVQDAVSMEVNLPTIRGFQEAVAVLWKEAGHECHRGLLEMTLDETVLSVNQFLKLPSRGLKCPPQDGREWFVHIPLSGFSPDYYVMAMRDLYFNDNSVWIPRTLMMVRDFHRYAAADNVIANLFELRNLLCDEVLDFVRFLNASKRHLQGYLHSSSFVHEVIRCFPFLRVTSASIFGFPRAPVKNRAKACVTRLYLRGSTRESFCLA